MALPRFVQFPAAFDAPEDVLRQLREIDPTAELLYWGDGQWLLGVVSPNRVRTRLAEQQLASVYGSIDGATADLSDVRAAVHDAVVARQGFRPIALYATPNPDGRIVEDFRRADWTFRHDADRAFRDQFFGSKQRASEANRKALLDRDVLKDDWRYAFTRSHAVTRRDHTTAARSSVRTLHLPS